MYHRGHGPGVDFITGGTCMYHRGNMYTIDVYKFCVGDRKWKDGVNDGGGRWCGWIGLMIAVYGWVNGWVSGRYMGWLDG